MGLQKLPGNRAGQQRRFAVPVSILRAAAAQEVLNQVAAAINAVEQDGAAPPLRITERGLRAPAAN
jgi:hypothetical protein